MSIRRQTVSMSILTWAIEARPESQVISAECQVCSITRTAESCSAVGGASRPIASRMIAVVSRDTVSTSGLTLRSANVRARTIASASCGSRCSARKARISVSATRAAGSSPAGGRLRSVVCMCWSWSCIVATSRCTLDGKYRYRVPSATPAASATSRIWTASKPPRLASWALACRIRRRRASWRSVRGGDAVVARAFASAVICPVPWRSVSLRC